MMQAPPRDRIIAGSGTALVLSGAAALLLSAFDVPVGRVHDAVLALVDIRQAPPPPPVQPPPVQIKDRARGTPSPRNLRNKATDVVAPKPAILVPPPPLPVVTAPAPDVGAAANSGASDLAGPGRGAGGVGDGTGAGGDGEGDGTPPRQIRGHLSMGDLPAEIRATGWSGKVGVRYKVGVDGRVSDCTIDRSSGEPRVDSLTCQLIADRFRFKPSLDPDGRPVRSVVIESHEWVIEREQDR